VGRKKICIFTAKKMIEILTELHQRYGIEKDNIEEIVCGKKYLAVLLKNGQIGVCATLNMDLSFDINDFDNLNLRLFSHRAFAQAYFNAVFNYQLENPGMDIFEKLDFKQYKNIVMIGFFRSLVEKFKKEHIPLQIFDKTEEDEILENMENQMKAISTADIIILTSTSIFNNSFDEIYNNSKADASIFMLGPSGIMHLAIFIHFPKIKWIFGARFAKKDYRVLDCIKAGKGTRSFLPYMQKMCYANPSNAMNTETQKLKK
jgi:hypothetical protein